MHEAERPFSQTLLSNSLGWPANPTASLAPPGDFPLGPIVLVTSHPCVCIHPSPTACSSYIILGTFLTPPNNNPASVNNHPSPCLYQSSCPHIQALIRIGSLSLEASISATRSSLSLSDIDFVAYTTSTTPQH